MSKIKKLASAAILPLLATALVACGGNSESSSTPTKPSDNNPTEAPTVKPTEKPTVTPTPEPNPDIDLGGIKWEGYYPITTMNKANELKVISFELSKIQSVNRNKYLTAACFQGIMNRDEVRYFVKSDMSKSGKIVDQYWIDELKKEYDIKTVDIDYEGMIKDYKATFKEDAGYILYDQTNDKTIGEDHTRSITAAVNMAAIRNWLPVDVSQEEMVKSLGLEKKLDVTDKDEKWVFDNYKDEFNNNILVQQRPMESDNMPMISLRDFAISNKLFTFFEASTSGSAAKFRTAVHKWAKPNMPIMGWGPGDEGGHISFASKFGQFPVPSDFSNNLTVYSADRFHSDEIKQKNEFVPITPEAGKHYVAFGRSDGDNITVWSNEFPLSSSDFGSSTRGNFPMGWSIQPSMLDLAPAQMNIIYKNATEHDHFIAPVSGHGYMYPSTYPAAQRGQWYDNLNNYLGRTDLSVVEILDHGKGKFLDQNIANEYGHIENLKGGICLNGHHYEGGKGAVVWSDNGKPFIAPRESLWQAEKERITARINSYQKDYKSIEGYTFVNLHPWTHSYQDVEWVVNNLDEDVVVVSPEQLIDLISKNVPKENKLTLDPATDPVVIPVDPYENKFIENVEDWKGNCSFAAGALAINGVATKEYKLPNEDNLVLDMLYTGAGSMKIEMEINGVKKIIADNLQSYKGDGTTLASFPLDAYFTEYKNQNAKITITAKGIKIDNVTTASKLAKDPTSAGDPYIDTFDKTLEDYILYGNLAKGTNLLIKNGNFYLDGSDGWTGFFDRNVNSAIVKSVKLPNKDMINLKLNFKASDTGSEVRIDAIVGGKVYSITNGFVYQGKSQLYPYELILNDCNGQDLVLIIQQRDSNKNNGVGEIIMLDEVSITSPEVNPHNNTFDGGFEDWYQANGEIKAENGLLIFNGNATLEKKYLFNSLTVNYNHLLNLQFKNITAGMKYKFQALAGENVLFETELADIKELVQIEIPALAGLEFEVTLRLQIVGEGSASLDSFEASTKSTIDPYNNTFKKNLEDWSVVSSTGWSNNGAQKDANWPRMQLTFVNSNEATGSVVTEKTYTLMDSRNIRLTFDIEGYNAFEKRGNCLIQIVIDGKAYDLSNDNLASGRTQMVFELDKLEALNGVAYEGKEVTIRITITNNGVGSEKRANDAWLWGFKTEDYSL